MTSSKQAAHDAARGYDVFLSHNWQQKPWVRALHELLVKHGLRVFFDEESIAPGQNVVTAIEVALQASDHVVLVLSPSALASKWVAMEAQLTIHDDPSAEGGRLVPVIIEEIDVSALRPSIRSLNCLSLVDRSLRERQLRRLLTHVGARHVTDEELRRLLVAVEGGLVDSGPELTVARLDDVLGWGWDGIRLLRELIALDYTTIDGLVHGHEGDPEQWAPVFMNHPDTWRLLVSAQRQVAGYWHFAPLFPEEHALAKVGSLLDAQITADRVQLFELPGVFDIYFVQICMHPQFRQSRNVQLLFRTAFQLLDDLAASGIFVREVTANAYTEVGRSLCRAFNLPRLCQHCEHGDVHCGPISNVLQHPLAGRFPRLRERYRSQGLA